MKIISIRMLFLAALLWASQSFGAHVIFDLGGVLFDTNKKTAFGTIWKELAAYMGTFNNPTQAQTRLFEVLHALKPLENPEIGACDDEGRILPQYLRDWLSGTHDNDDLLEEILFQLRTHPQLYLHHTEQPLMEKVVTMMFTPEQFIHTRCIIKEGINFVHECKAQGHKIYVLSNWDKDSFKLLYEQNKELFDLFDGIIVSADVKKIKPDTTLYTDLLEQFNLQASECIFIDDQPENYTAAKKVGMHAIHVQKTAPFYAPWAKEADFNQVRTTFKKLLKKIA